MATNVYRQYQESAITQSDPVKLVELMYEGAIRFTNLAIKAIDEKDLEGAHNHILRSYAIVAELMATLDFEQGGKIAVQLEQCYDYMLHLYKEANIAKEKPKLVQVLGLIEPLLKAWQEAFPKGTVPVADESAGNGIKSGDVRENGKATAGSVPDSTPDKPEHKSLDLVG